MEERSDLIAKLDEEISGLEGVIKDCELEDVKGTCNRVLIDKKLARAYVAEQCPRCDGSGTKLLFEYEAPNRKHLCGMEPCPNPRHALIRQLRKSMGLMTEAEAVLGEKE